MAARIQFSKKLPTLNQIVSLLVLEALKRANGDKSIAAGMLGISGRELGQHIEKNKLLNKAIRNGVLVLLLVMLLPCSGSYAADPVIGFQDRIVVKFRADASPQSITALIKSYDMVVYEKIPQINYYVLQISDRYTLKEILRLWQQIDIVQTCEADHTDDIQSLPNDEYFYAQWSLDNNDEYYGAANADLHMLEAWRIETGREDIVVAIIDMGFDVTHEDLQHNIWTNPDEIPNNGIDDDENGYVDDIIGWDFVNQTSGKDGEEYDWKDEDNDPTIKKSSHGNSVLGLIGATANNNIGIAGVARNCKMMLIRAGFFKTDGTQSLSSLYIIKGLIYAADNGARVINISSGSYRYSQSYKDALQYAVDKGAIVVCSAGNSGSDTPVYPAAYDIAGLISVGSSSRYDGMCSFSNYGNWVDVSAPGEYLMTTLLENSYGKVKGTSFSAPLVTGIAALIVSKYPEMTPANVQDVIMNSVDVSNDLKDANLTSGRVNAYKALSEPSIDHYYDSAAYEGTTTIGSYEQNSSADNGCFVLSLLL